VLFIDRRERGLGIGPDDTDRPLLRYNLPVSVTELEFGDAMWEGKGPGGQTVLVGVERKRLSDLIKCMQDRRLSGFQLPGLNRTYAFVTLLVEEMWRPGPGGEIEVYGWVHAEKKHGWKPFYTVGPERERVSVNYRQVITYLHSLSLRAITTYGEPWRVIRTGTAAGTAAEYAALYHMWQKPWDEHKAHEAVYCGDLPIKGHGGGWGDVHGHEEAQTYVRGRVGVFKSETQLPPSTLWRMAMQLPGVDKRARGVAEHWKTVRNMALAGLPKELKERVDKWYDEHPGEAEKAWRELDGIGAKVSAAVVRAISEEGA
jgi:hypothetical protein